ncbi:MAG: phosphatidylserine decarboxylase family protein [Calditrichia bacterium]|nr:phosphatidylserine decarboxylase family protein [Calditrichia bacterium]
MKITPYGYNLIIAGFLFFIIFLALTMYFKLPVFKVFTIVFGIVAVFNLYFFRDPERRVTSDANTIFSPADGKVVLIKEVLEQEFFKGPALQISIFLSVFNVHVNRIPISGKVEYFKYKEGKFLAAFKHEASDSNEQTMIGISGNKGKVLFKQIAGIIARRIICTVKEGDEATQGDRMGMIKYGSRVDVFLPVSCKVFVKNGDVVKGGLSVLGEFNI